MNLDALTVQNCIDEYEKGMRFLINSGKVTGYQKEEIPTQTANPSGDNK